MKTSKNTHVCSVGSGICIWTWIPRANVWR